MITFDQAYVYQFTLFFDESAEVAPERLAELPALLSRPVQGIEDGLAFKLGRPQIEQAFIVQGSGSIAPGQTQTWRGPAGIWRVVWTPSRLDVHFDARGYAEVMEDPVTPLIDVRRRLLPNLARVPAETVLRVNRLALIVTAQASCGVGQPRPAHLVAATFFHPDILAAADRGEVLDPVARVNQVTTMPLQQATDIRVNRNETGTANWTMQNGVEETSLSWQLDVNTSPVHALTANFERAAILAFFESAETWLTDRVDRLQRVA